MTIQVEKVPKNKAALTNYLVISTYLKKIHQIGSFPQIGLKIKKLQNHHWAKCQESYDDLSHIVTTPSLLTPQVSMRSTWR